MNASSVNPPSFPTLGIIVKEIVTATRTEALKDDRRPTEEVVEEILVKYFGPVWPAPRPPDPPRMNTSAADGATMWAALVASSVAPTVRAVRQVAFGDVAPPFRTYPEAVAWVEAQGRTGLPGAPIPYWDAEGESATVPAATDQLRTIAEAVTILGVLTPWGPEAALMHLLCGGLPVGPADPTVTFSGPVPSVRLGRGAAVAGFRATIEVAPWQVEALPAVAEVLKKHWSVEQERWVLSGDNAKLADLIVRHGPPPRPGRGVDAGTLAYWRDLAGAWGETYDDDRAPDALRMRWGRFRERWPRLAALLGDGPWAVSAAAGEQQDVSPMLNSPDVGRIPRTERRDWRRRFQSVDLERRRP